MGRRSIESECSLCGERPGPTVTLVRSHDGFWECRDWHLCYERQAAEVRELLSAGQGVA